MKISKHYVELKTAKWLKSKGFEIKVRRYYHINTFIDSISCFEENHNETKSPFYSAPEQHQVVEWLLRKHKILITVTSISQESWQFHITKPGDSLGQLYDEDFVSPQQAYQAAFDYIEDKDLI